MYFEWRQNLRCRHQWSSNIGIFSILVLTIIYAKHYEYVYVSE